MTEAEHAKLIIRFCFIFPFTPKKKKKKKTSRMGVGLKGKIGDGQAEWETHTECRLARKRFVPCHSLAWCIDFLFTIHHQPAEACTTSRVAF